MDNMPACMMPDGAEPCASWTELRKRIEELESALKILKGFSVDRCKRIEELGTMNTNQLGLLAQRGEVIEKQDKRIEQLVSALRDYCENGYTEHPAVWRDVFLDLLTKEQAREVK